MAGGRTRRQSVSVAAAALAALLTVPAIGAGQGPAPGAAGGLPDDAPRIRLTAAGGGAAAAVEVVGLPADALAAVAAAGLAPEAWARLLRVAVADGAASTAARPAVLGAWAVAGGALRFTPRYGFDPGREYRVTFDPAALPVAGGSGAAPPGPLAVTLRAPDVERVAATRVTRIYPTAGVIPENQLRFYVHFSAPMGREGGSRHVQLLDAAGRAVEDAFLPLDVAMWNGERTRYTLLFDPGRVKRGILPNRRAGRPLAAGESFTITINRAWRDASGLPLVESFRRSFTVGPPEQRALDPAAWGIEPGASGTRNPLVVSFGRALDHALLQRTLVVLSTPDGRRVAGAAAVRAAETRWVFTPREPWQGREYRLAVLPALEDPAGNRVGRPFEVGASGLSPGRGPEGPTLLPFYPAAAEASTPSAAAR